MKVLVPWCETPKLVLDVYWEKNLKLNPETLLYDWKRPELPSAFVSGSNALVSVWDPPGLAHEYLGKVKILDMDIQDYVLEEHDPECRFDSLIWRPFKDTDLRDSVVDRNPDALRRFEVFMRQNSDLK